MATGSSQPHAENTINAFKSSKSIEVHSNDRLSHTTCVKYVLQALPFGPGNGVLYAGPLSLTALSKHSWQR